MKLIKNILKQWRERGPSRLFQLLKSEEIMISLQAMKEHRMRTFLTMLGIVFGVGAVISMLAIGEGARKKALKQISSLGLKNIIIKNKSNANLQNNDRLLNDGDVDALQDIIENLDYGTGLMSIRQSVKNENIIEEVEIIGINPYYFKLMELKLQSGGYFSFRDNDYKNRVCVLGSEIARKLFKLKAAPDKEIRIKDQWFKVVGVLKYKPVRSTGDNQIDFNNRIYIPLQTLRQRFERDPKKAALDQLIVHVDQREKVIGCSQIIEQILFRRHNSTNNFDMIVPEELLRQSAETQKIFNIVMGAIAGISLLVGGIGIMNIMLASILERTREIGLRRSIGATKNDIKTQFLTESILISLGGGISGILLGYLLTYIVTLYTDWNTVVTLWSILLAFGVSSLVGIIFGYFPAKKAANLDPIEALRYE
ncbi:MAG: ABC transporter permease [Candidatus Marinimicrobia bacterium]|nr:ABC transporter permease [Candidatus Neomarinimicrobiota bacterium]